MSAAPESYGTDLTVPETEVPSLTLELVPPPLPDLFEAALFRPNHSFEAIPTAELQAIRRQGGEDASTHFLSTVLLRLADNPTSIADYSYYRVNLKYDQSLRAHSNPSRKQLAESTTRLEKAGRRAAPYIEMFDIVDAYRHRYRQAYDASSTAGVRAEFISAIYDQSEAISHPGLGYIRDSLPTVREAAIEAERLLRIMLIDTHHPLN